ncbi:folylpolyglutamate synthase/dihydrofolate synthase family protein [Chloracidobacterium aggregatum]|uniref:bifunctional folylpolyglutamate synthase/dihydrofolate synthase n=1 Tax=Chloracidobacterium aggregatum TaxID=2851959 RepID=UPI001B8DA9F7|nr:folylpolyglutamate synthase/dihydrofolate synthase family protein [Chloracidobacterium aggregatum]QUV88233.1 bifunctional folylpolyglutamate synthase/dihydrofolate synthase [Chloracidobacterium sp. S]QUV91153.1 bifunctional folylpolyglutamate synthase/dihydrofolate synthase [Chloracidobacterium sp. A]
MGLTVDFESAVRYLYALGNEVTAMKLGLDAVTALLEALGRPDRNFTPLHVAGTNGKGSTCAFLASIFHQAGLRTGLYTSPHLMSPVERIRLNGQAIPEAAFAEVMTQVHDAVESLLEEGRLAARPTFFEHLTAAAFTYLAARQAEVVVAEVGLGGRLDATNVLHPAAAVITNIGEDHREWLGPTLSHIAREKAGIIKPGVPVYLADTQPEEARRVLAHSALAQQVEPQWVAPFETVHLDATGCPSVRFDQRFPSLEGGVCRLSLRGRHQTQNAALAAVVAQAELRRRGVAESDIGRAIVAGLETTHWPGRLQWLETTPPVLLDGAHNPQGAQALAHFLESIGGRRPRTAIFATMRDKPAADLLSALASGVDRLILTEVKNQPRTMPRESLEVIALGYWLPSGIIQAPDVAMALARARELTPPEGLILVCGSIYLIGEALQALQVPVL